MKRLLAVFLAVLAFAPFLASQDIRRDGPRVSPFRGMRQVATGIEVQIDDDTWFALDAMGGVDTKTLLAEAERLCGSSAWKRITEDMPALFEAMGHPLGRTVDVDVRDLATGARSTKKAVALTAANRARLLAANGGARPGRPASVPGGPLTRSDAVADLEELRGLLDTSFAYRDLRGVDVEAVIERAKTACGAAEIARDDFVRVVDGVLRAFGDGHSRVDGVDTVHDVFLPCLVQEAEGGHVAFSPGRDALVDPARPFVVAIDGQPIATWLAAARARSTQGSAAMQARGAERLLRDLGDLRADLGRPVAGDVTLRLRGATGERNVVLRPSSRRPAYGEWPRTKTRRVGDFGCLRIAAMSSDEAFLDGLDAAMASFRDTKGLVIDVRGNGGGSRDALRRLAPYLLPADGTPVVGNVAAVLLDAGATAPEDALADRGLWRADWNGWSAPQAAAVRAVAKSFAPSWKLPAGRFSPWHYLVLDRADNPKAFAYTRPVIVLIDRGCFSATDVFAAALGALPNVRLVGEATSGGSGRARGFTLGKSGVRLQLSSMASFRPDGVLFEGNGVVPDVAVATLPTDLIGTTDTVLQRAIELLR